MTTEEMTPTYDPASSKAGEFINDKEILDTIEYAKAHKDDRPLVESIISKAALCKGLSHREAAVLMECTQSSPRMRSVRKS